MPSSRVSQGRPQSLPLAVFVWRGAAGAMLKDPSDSPVKPRQMLVRVAIGLHGCDHRPHDLNSLHLLDVEVAAAWKRSLAPVVRKRTDATEAEPQYRFEYFNSGFR